jgi:hypothetical protein
MVPLGAGVRAAYCSCQLLPSGETPLKVLFEYSHKRVAYKLPSCKSIKWRSRKRTRC